MNISTPRNILGIQDGKLLYISGSARASDDMSRFDLPQVHPWYDGPSYTSGSVTKYHIL